MNDAAIRTQFLRDAAQFPLWVALETTSRCNAACSICPHRNMRRPQGDMDMALYRRLVDECAAAGNPELRLLPFLHGEPLLDPLLPERLAYARQRGLAHLLLSTNAALLDAAAGARLRDSGLTELIISIDGTSAATYAASRAGLDFATVVRNAESFLAARGEVRVTLRMIVTDINRYEQEAFRAQWTARGAEVELLSAHNWGDGAGMDAPLPPQCPCMAPWVALAVLHDGTAALCCLDREGAHAIGDAGRDGIAAVWRGERMQAVRAAHLDRAYARVALCARCSYTFDRAYPDWWFARAAAS